MKTGEILFYIMMAILWAFLIGKMTYDIGYGNGRDDVAYGRIESSEATVLVWKEVK